MKNRIQSTKKVQRVLVYLDSVVFGGHDITLLEAVKGLAMEPGIKVYLMVPQDNTRFIDRLSLLKNDITIIKHVYHTAPGDVFRVIFRTSKVRHLMREMLKHEPDLIIVSQGAIALSACGLGAAKMAGVPLMSFLPMAHSVALIRGINSIQVALQEFVYRYLYALPDFFFTLCRTTQNQLEQLHRVDTKQIFVSYYGLDTSKRPKPELKYKQELSKEKHIALLGRVEFYQKQHDFFVRQLAAFKDEIGKVTLHIIGDGPDLDKLKQLVQELNLQSIVEFVEWVDDMEPVYKTLDAILLPSRFEGFPLVMVEAMYWGVPVIASKVDGMEEVLPDEWLFPVNDGKEMVRCIRYVLNNDQREHLLKNQQCVFDTMNVNTFRKGFCKSVVQCLKRKKQA